MTADLRFRLRADVALEDFGDRSLALLCGSLRLREINAAARKILGCLDGERTAKDIAERLAGELAGDAAARREAVAAALRRLEAQGVVRRVAALGQERIGTMGATRYLADPDVSFRQEDDEGGILFHAEADAVEVINPTATAIWKLLAAPRTQAEIVAHLCATFQGAPPAQVARDVDEFIAAFLKKGFVGVVEASA